MAMAVVAVADTGMAGIVMVEIATNEDGLLKYHYIFVTRLVYFVWAKGICTV